MKKYLILFFAVFAIAACDSRLSTNDLSEVVVDNMYESEFFTDIEIDSLILTRDSAESNKYTGILTTNEPYGTYVYTVAVTYDGENMTWQIVE